ncbi:MAG: hypothetical protein ACOX0E_03960 [Syntrophomonadaceae bacterium]|jgi:hypothetical protein
MCSYKDGVAWGGITKPLLDIINVEKIARDQYKMKIMDAGDYFDGR